MNEKTVTEPVSDFPWREKNSFSKVENRKIIIAMVAVLICSLGLILYPNEQISFFLSLLLFVDVILTVRAPGSVAILLLTALFGFFLTSGFSGSVIVLSLIVGTGSLAWLLTVLRSYHFLFALCPIFAVFLASWIWTQRPDEALLALAFLPSAVALAAATVTHRHRTSAICFATGGFLLSLGIGIVLLMARYGALSAFSDLPSRLAQLRSELGDVLIASRDELFERLTDSLLIDGYTADEISETINVLKQNFSDGTIRSAVSMFFVLLPALIVTVCNVLSFEAQLFLNHAYLHCGWKQVLTLHATVFTMSVPAGILYVIGFLAMLFFDGTSLLGAALQNLCLILLPGLCVLGWGAVLSGIHHAGKAQKMLICLFLAAMICCSGIFSVYLLALWGAGNVCSTALHAHLSKNMPTDENDGNDESNR